MSWVGSTSFLIDEETEAQRCPTAPRVGIRTLAEPLLELVLSTALLCLFWFHVPSKSDTFQIV